MNSNIYGGIEGGGSRSIFALIKGNGTPLCVINGPLTNHWALGMEKCVEVIHDIVKTGFSKAGLDENTKLSALGLCLSGCEEEQTTTELKNMFLNKYPDIADSVSVVSDTVGSILTANPTGGIVLISGTGSNSLLLNEDGTSARCGGWGHSIGDEGGAFWIANSAIRQVFYNEDNFNASEYDCTAIKKVMMEHFNITDKAQMLTYYYTDFDKPTFAAMCKKLSEVARDEKDPLCCDIFRRAGKDLGKYVQALKPSIKMDSQNQCGIPIICVGEVFNSWDLLKDGFLEGMNGCLEEYTLLRLKVSAAYGATYYGAKNSGFELNINFKENTSVMFHYKQ